MKFILQEINWTVLELHSLLLLDAKFLDIVMSILPCQKTMHGLSLENMVTLLRSHGMVCAIF